MSTRTVRFDDEDERHLLLVCDSEGMSVSEALKYGLAVASEQLLDKHAGCPWDVYAALDLGPGGTARAPARQAKQALRGILARKHRR